MVGAIKQSPPAGSIRRDKGVLIRRGRIAQAGSIPAVPGGDCFLARANMSEPAKK